MTYSIELVDTGPTKKMEIEMVLSSFGIIRRGLFVPFMDYPGKIRPQFVRETAVLRRLTVLFYDSCSVYNTLTPGGRCKPVLGESFGAVCRPF